MNEGDSMTSSYASNVKGMVSNPIGITLADVGGHSTIKRELQTSVLLPMKRPHIFYGGPQLRGDGQ